MYWKPLLASYSRSGTNWVRYIIEYISGRPTPGGLVLHAEGDPVVDRAHNASKVMNRYRKVLLLVRDYRECLLRQNREHWLETQDVGRFLTSQDVRQPPDWYIKNLLAFDAHRGEKLLVHYEDLQASPEVEIPRIGTFLELDPGRTADFLENVEERYKESVSAYTGRGHASASTAQKDPKHHSKELLAEEHARLFDRHFETNHPEIFGKYLSRYRVTDVGL